MTENFLARMQSVRFRRADVSAGNQRGSCRFPSRPHPVKTEQRSVRRRSAVPNLKIIFPLKMRKATRRAFQIVSAYHAKPHLEK